MLSLPYFLDFEASSLALQSYPIEVAWSDEEGQVEEYLINPDPIPAWTDWDPVAEEDIHRISRDELRVRGKDPRWVATRMNTALQRKTVYCDGLPLDGHWRDRLFAAAKLVPEFSLGDMNRLISRIVPQDPGSAIYQDNDHHALPDRVIRYQQEARAKVPGSRHRAGNDVRYLIEYYKLVVLSI